MKQSEMREEDARINLMCRSDTIIGEDKGSWTDTQIREEMGLKGRESFMEVSTLGSRDQHGPEIGPSMLTTFLETYMSLLHDSKAVKGLQELMNRCTGLGEPRIIKKLGKQLMDTSREMLLTV